MEGCESTTRKALVNSKYEKRFELARGAPAEVLILLANLDMEDSFREPVLLELHHLCEFQLETVIAFAWHKLYAVFAKMKPAAAVVHNVVSGELFVRMRNEECRSASSFERLVELLF